MRQDSGGVHSEVGTETASGNLKTVGEGHGVCLLCASWGPALEGRWLSAHDSRQGTSEVLRCVISLYRVHLCTCTCLPVCCQCEIICSTCCFLGQSSSQNALLASAGQ